MCEALYECAAPVVYALPLVLLLARHAKTRQRGNAYMLQTFELSHVVCGGTVVILANYH